MRAISVVVTSVLLAACSTGSSIMSSGPDLYSVTERRAPVLGGAMKAKEDALSESNQYCQNKGSAFFLVSEHESAFPVGNPWGNTDYALTFRCAGAASSDVDDLPLTDTHYRITAHGRSPEETDDLALLHASEIALDHGYRGFVVDKTTDQSITQAMTSAGYTNTSAGATVAGGYGFATGTGSATTTYAPPTTTNASASGVSLFIALVQKGGLDAKLIYAKLAPKYGRPPRP